MTPSNHSRAAGWRDQLAASTYGQPAFDLVRYREDPTDEAVRGVVAAAVAGEESERDQLRASLDEDDKDTLRLFGMRRALQARRRASFGLIDDAIDGFALLPAVNDVPWESWLKTTLFVARELGRDLDSVGQRFADVASTDVLARFDVALDAMYRIQSMAQCHVVEVTTSYGIGFVETLVYRDATRARFFSSVPRQADFTVPYSPSTNLAQLAANLADALDATGTVVTGPLGQDQLAASSFSLAVPGSYVETMGCLSFGAGSTNQSASFTVFVAEPADGEDIAALVSAATIDGQAAFADASRLVLLVAQPRFDADDADDADDAEPEMGDFAEIVSNNLRETAATRWLPQ